MVERVGLGDCSRLCAHAIVASSMRALTPTDTGRWPTYLTAIAVSLTLLSPLHAANAQQAKRTYRIGILSELAPTTTAAGGSRALFSEDTWRAAFRQRGYVEDQNTHFEFRYAGGEFERLPALTN